MTNAITPELDELDRILDEEYQCLLRGDLKSLPIVLERKQAFLDSLDGDSVSAAPMLSDAISGKAERNQKLLSSAAAGLRSVLRRLLELRSISDGSGTYQANGRRHQKLTPTRGVSRRA